MSNLIEFGRGFLSYGLLFVIASALVVAAVLIGIRLRKNKDEKDAVLAAAAGSVSDAGSQDRA